MAIEFSLAPFPKQFIMYVMMPAVSSLYHLK